MSETVQVGSKTGVSSREEIGTPLHSRPLLRLACCAHTPPAQVCTAQKSHYPPANQHWWLAGGYDLKIEHF